MTARDYEARFIYDLCLQSGKGLGTYIEETYVEQIRQDYDRQLNYDCGRNKNIFRRLGLMKEVVTEPFGQYLAWRWDLQGSFFDMPNFETYRRSHKSAISLIAKVKKLAEENARAAQMMSVSAEDYHSLCFYASKDRSSIN